MNTVLSWAVARLSEASTWSAISALVGSMTFLSHASQDAQMVGIIGTAVSGALGIAIAEGRKS